MSKTPPQEIESNAATWSYAELWDKFPIPARPDAEELALEEQEIALRMKQNPDLSLLILGSTIEYRSLAKRLGIVPHVVDFSAENFASLTAYASERFEEEKFVQSDWLEIPFQDKFQVILGHRPFNVIRHDQVETLFRKIHEALQEGGVCFCRGNVTFPEDQDTLDELIRTFGKAKDRPYRLFSYLEVPLYIHCADSRGYLDYPKARAVMQRYHEMGLVTDEDYADIRPLISMADGTKFRSFIPIGELEEHIRAAGFRDIERIFTSHSFTKNMPIFKLTK
jgi:hypothetical protein